MNDKKLSVYLETSVISYLTSKPSQNIVTLANQQVTRQWWEKERNLYDLFISGSVLDEISQGDAKASSSRLEKVKEIKVLSIDNQVQELSNLFIESRLIPPKSYEDALHLSYTIVQKIDILLTWNCKHLANLEILRMLQNICNPLNLTLPDICTPYMLTKRGKRND